MAAPNTPISDYRNLKGTTEKGPLNNMPPGQDITNQTGGDIRELPLKTITPLGYPGDGGFPTSD